MTAQPPDTIGRLLIGYEISAGDPASVADAIRTEQTIEFPHDLAPEWIQDTVVGRVERINGSRVDISYDVGVTGGELIQLLNVLWGDVSLCPGVRVVDLAPPDDLAAAIGGPRFGVAGLRALLGAPDRPLVTTALKPMGSSAADLAADAATLARSGFDIIKDDHGLADQPWAPWQERVTRCAAAVAEVNTNAGTRALYMPSLNVAGTELLDRAHPARELGAGALLVLPGLVGFGGMRALARDDSLALPIMSHPSMLGSMVVNPARGCATVCCSA